MPWQHPAIQRQRVQQIRDQRPRAAHPARKAPVFDRNHAFQPRERLADHPADETAGCGGGFPRADADRGKAEREPVDVSPPRVVVDQDLADEFFRAVAALRVGEDGLVHHGREGGAVDCLAAGVDDADPWAGAANGLEEGAGGVDVNAHAELEVGFGPRGHDAVEDVGGVEGFVDDLGGIGGEVAFDGLGVGGVERPGGDGDVDHVGENQRVGGGFEEFAGHELAEEAAGAGDEDFHGEVGRGREVEGVGDGMDSRV